MGLRLKEAANEQDVFKSKGAENELLGRRGKGTGFLWKQEERTRKEMATASFAHLPRQEPAAGGDPEALARPERKNPPESGTHLTHASSASFCFPL